MRSSTLLALTTAMGGVMAAPQLPDASCFGCTVGSECVNYQGDLHFSFNTYYLADRWVDTFGNSGDMPSETVRAVCDTDWCIYLQNLGGGNRGYTYEQAALAAGHVKSGAVDGCSNYKQQFIDTGNPDTSDYYLRFNIVSSAYSGLCGQGSITEFYGSQFEGGTDCIDNCANPDFC